LCEIAQTRRSLGHDRSLGLPLSFSRLEPEKNGMPRGTIIATVCVLAWTLSACGTAYMPYAVERNPAPARQFDSLPVVLSQPVAAAADYRVYRAASGTDLYVIPTALEADASRVKAEAINFERHDGQHQIVVLWARPRGFDIQDVADAYPGARVRPYPVDRLTTRTLTEIRDPTVLRVTATREPAAASPFGLMVAIQVFGRDNIKDMKALLATPSGFLMEARFVLQTSDHGQMEMAIPVNFGSVTLTEQTL
jgi:hypothetical protein